MYPDKNKDRIVNIKAKRLGRLLRVYVVRVVYMYFHPRVHIVRRYIMRNVFCGTRWFVGVWAS